MKRFCFYCGSPFQPKRETAKFCTPNCRLQHHRERHKREIKHADTLIKQWNTKHDHYTVMQCCGCNNTFLANGAQMMKMYCTPLCRGRAYRERRAYRMAAARRLVFSVPRAVE